LIACGRRFFLFKPICFKQFITVDAEKWARKKSYGVILSDLADHQDNKSVKHFTDAC
jgi:hypothetical protein